VEERKLVQTYMHHNWWREVNRIISAGTYAKSMVYDIQGQRYTINPEDNTITVEEL
jgi:hypothetical protein